MDDKEKVKFSDEEIEGIAKAIALADMAARAPKEKNPSIPMVKDEFYYKALAEVKKKYAIKK